MPGTDCVGFDSLGVRARFAGLDPGSAGVYRIEFELPVTAPTGNVEFQVLRINCYRSALYLQSPLGRVGRASSSRFRFNEVFMRGDRPRCTYEEPERKRRPAIDKPSDCREGSSLRVEYPAPPLVHMNHRYRLTELHNDILNDLAKVRTRSSPPSWSTCPIAASNSAAREYVPLPESEPESDRHQTPADRRAKRRRIQHMKPYHGEA